MWIDFVFACSALLCPALLRAPQVVQVLKGRGGLHVPGLGRVQPLRQGVPHREPLEGGHGAGGRAEHEPVEVLQGKLGHLYK